ncbi:MAG: hypothetical protein ILO42_00130 [Clostridia bacterium]|nr:hypothetical protein [Clostridia bacterium]MBP5269343.1 hypothetical protein [Clostridia bacterium]
MRFAVKREPGEKTGADIYVLIFQSLSIIFPLFVIATALYPDMLFLGGVVSFIWNFGICALPRAETVPLSLLYRLTSGETVVALAVLAVAIAFAVIAKRLFSEEKTAFASRVTVVCLITADLVVRLLPLHSSRVFGLPEEICAFVLRLVCLALVVGDLVAEIRRRKMRTQSERDVDNNNY